MNRDTICVQGGYTPGNGEPRQIPIIQSTTFKYATSEDMGKPIRVSAELRPEVGIKIFSLSVSMAAMILSGAISLLS